MEYIVLVLVVILLCIGAFIGYFYKEFRKAGDIIKYQHKLIIEIAKLNAKVKEKQHKAEKHIKELVVANRYLKNTCFALTEGSICKHCNIECEKRIAVNENKEVQNECTI